MKNECNEMKIEQRLTYLSDDNQALFRDACNYIRSAPVSDKKAGQLINQILNEWLYAEKNEIELEVNKQNIEDYCEKRLLAVPEVSVKLRLAWALRGGFIVLCVLFSVQMIVQFIGFFDPVQTTSFSFFPFLLLGLFGLSGIYLLHASKSRKRPIIWKVVGYASQFVGVLLFLASMRLWDRVMTITLNFPLTVLFLIGAIAGFVLIGRWKQLLEQEEEQRDNEGAIPFTADNQPR